MHRFLNAALALAFLAGMSGVADAKSCRDAKGKFVKCPVAAAPAPKKSCRDAKGKFTKCAAAGHSMGSHM